MATHDCAASEGVECTCVCRGVYHGQKHPRGWHALFRGMTEQQIVADARQRGIVPFSWRTDQERKDRDWKQRWDDAQQHLTRVIARDGCPPAFSQRESAALRAARAAVGALRLQRQKRAA